MPQFLQDNWPWILPLLAWIASTAPPDSVLGKLFGLFVKFNPNTPPAPPAPPVAPTVNPPEPRHDDRPVIDALIKALPYLIKIAPWVLAAQKTESQSETPTTEKPK